MTQLFFDFDHKLLPHGYVKNTIRKKAQDIVTASVKRIRRETDPDKKWKYKIIKREFSKLIDDLA
jgi:hypothetical protein